VAARRRLALLYCVLLAAYSVGWIRLIRMQPPATLGFESRYRPSAARLDVANILPHGPAEKAGLRKGDRIVTINGKPIDSYEPFLNLRSHARPGDVAMLEVERDGTPVALLLTAAALERPRLAAGSWLPPTIGSAIEQLLSLYPLPFLIVAATVLLQRPEDPHAWLLALMLGGFITAPPLLELEHRISASWRGVFFAFWALFNVPLAAVTYAFFSVFPAHSPLDRRVPWLKYFGIGLALALGLPLAIGSLAYQGSYPLWWLEERFLSVELGFRWVITLYSIGFMLLALVSLALNAFGPHDVQRKTRVILFGMAVGTLPIVAIQAAITSNVVTPTGIPPLVWALAILALFAIPVSLGYAVVKHRAMEIPALLRRSARYVLVRRGMVTLAILVGLAVTFGFVRIVGRVSDLPGDQLSMGLLAGSLFGGLLALVGQRAWQPAAERLDRAFFRGSYDARRVLQTLAQESRTATDRSSLAILIDDSVLQALHPQTLLVFLRGGDDWTFSAAAHEGLSGDDARLPATTGQLNNLARRGRPLLIDPQLLADGGPWATFAALAPEALVPLVGRSGQLEGLLVLGRRLSDEPYSGEDVALLASVGTQAGLALENIRLAETMAARLEAERRTARDLEIARDVQLKLLPQDRPPLSTLDYAGACLQARIVGGDFFDFVSMGAGQVGLVLADISGKGISAALLMATLQANLRALYAQARHDLAGLLSTVNKVFYDSTAANHYATLFFGLYDEATRELRYANCGHLPPIVRRATGAVERLTVTGPVVGLFEPWQCDTRSVRLDREDLLVIFTDGVTDATGPEGEEFGEQRLLDVIAEHHDRSARALLQEIVDDVKQYGGPEQFDDLTLIVAKAV
jgi:sigma-B regulation protein RsbU (phosphoserine phosphatase)